MIAVVYSVIHLLKWNFPFPTPIEMYLWRVSRVAILVVKMMAWGVFEVISVQSDVDVRADFLFWGRERRTTARAASSGPGRQCSWWRDYSVTVFGAVCSVVYVLSRTALIVEIVISLRWLPVSVYQTVPWPEYLPKVG